MPPAARTIVATSPTVAPLRGTNARASFAEQHVERFATIRACTGRDERIGELRAADRPARSARGVGDERTQSRPAYPRSVRRPAITFRRRSRSARCARRKSTNGANSRIDEVAEDVDVARRFDRGDLDAGNKTKAVPCRQRPALRQCRRWCRDR